MQTHSLEEFKKIAADFVQNLRPLGHRATVVGLYGDLGAGKTTFVQAAAKALGISISVVSPTFLIQKRYMIHDSRFRNLVHIDAYRLESSDELKKLRFEELLADPRNLIFVEWADKVMDILPQGHRRIHFTYLDESKREVTILN